MKQNIKYEEAYNELHNIMRKMENDELDIDQLALQLKRAKQLIKLCKDRITKAEEEVQAILTEEQ